MSNEYHMENDSHYEPHRPARPMVVILDDNGTPWICDEGADPDQDLPAQGCWNCGEVPFTRND